MITKILKKIAQGRTWEVDGYKYTFTDIFGWDGDENVPHFEVSAQLPKPYQSYILQKMTDDVQEIISDLISYTGEEIRFVNMNLLLGDSEPAKMFVTYEMIEKIISTLNRQINKQHYRTNTDGKEITFGIRYSPSKTFYETDYESVRFFLNLSIFDIRMDGEVLEIPIERYDGLAKIFEDVINLELDIFRSNVEDVFYTVLEPEVKIKNSEEIFYSSFFNIVKIDGVDVIPKEDLANDEILSDFI